MKMTIVALGLLLSSASALADGSCAIYGLKYMVTYNATFIQNQTYCVSADQFDPTTCPATEAALNAFLADKSQQAQYASFLTPDEATKNFELLCGQNEQPK